MNNFNYCNYIGDHMGEPLMVLEPTNLTTELTYKNIGFIAESGDHVPKIKSISDLTDDEWLFVGFGNNEIEKSIRISRYTHYIDIIENGIINTRINTDYINNISLTQNQWNRLYSLHISLDYNELIKNNKAVRKG